MCVRLIQANGLDLARFHFDFDLSFAAFVFAPDGALIGRYGSRSGSGPEAEREISMAGLVASLERALDLFARLSEVRGSLAAKAGPRPPHPTPEAFPTLGDRFGPELAEGDKVAASCIHCHMIRDATRREVRAAGRPITGRLLFPWPMPDLIGMRIDPATATTVAKVAPDSPAGRAGLRAGDEVISADGQPLISAADIQWVLESAAETDRLPVTVRRDGALEDLALELPEGWRRRSDISWRVSTWDLRRMALGGLVLEPVEPEARERLGLGEGLALRVRHVGQYGEHAVAKQAGFREGDVVTAFGELKSPASESEVIAHALESHGPGDVVPVEVRRTDRDRPHQLELRQQ